MGAVSYPNSARALAESKNIFLRAMRTSVRLARGGRCVKVRATASAANANPSAMESGSLIYRLSVLVRAFLRQAKLGPKTNTVLCHTVHIESTPPLPVQLDGDVIGHLPMTFSLVPQALSVIVPANTPEDIFHQPELLD